jgi:methionyl-tRNA formyltransferase
MMQRPLKIVFMGTPEFAAAALQAILTTHHEVICVYSQPPRPKGRGQALQKSPVHEMADAAGIPVRTPLSFKRDQAAVQDFMMLGADVAIVAAYGLILPQSVLDAPRYGCVNIHASILPRWRGASPLQRAIWSGDRETGITLMRMEAGLDTGPIIEIQTTPIDDDTTLPLLHDTLKALGGAMIVPFLERLSLWNKINSTPQDDSKTSYAPLLSKDDGRIDWAKDAVEIDRQIRALNPWPGVWTHTGDGVRLKVLAAKSEAVDGAYAPGEIIDKAGLVACAPGTALRLITLQPDNGKPMDAPAAANGGYLRIGASLKTI